MDLKYELIACENSSIPSSILQLVLKIGIFFESFFVDDKILFIDFTNRLESFLSDLLTTNISAIYKIPALRS